MALRTFTPFGEPLKADGTVDPDNVPDNMPGQMDHGWLGQHQRLYEHAGALSIVQTGARPYSPLFGRFLSVDPVEGGSANYVGGVAGAVACGVSVVCGVAVGAAAAFAGYAAINAGTKSWAWRDAIVETGFGAIGGRWAAGANRFKDSVKPGQHVRMVGRHVQGKRPQIAYRVKWSRGQHGKWW
ncbi:hypothetical protein ACQPW3_35660 [Actinosynnema sp. CA-248983]